MAGVKGKGGVKGRSGGARPGAGRKPKPKVDLAPTSVAGESSPVEIKLDPLEFLAGVYNNVAFAPNVRVRAAIAHAQYLHLKKGDGGKKDDQAAAAAQKVVGRFAPGAPPKLVAAGGRKV